MFKINKAVSFKKGIFFYSNHIPEFGVYSHLENGEIKVERRPFSAELLNAENILAVSKRKIKAISVILVLLTFVLNILFYRFVPNIGLATFCFFTINYESFFTLCYCFFDAHISKNTNNDQHTRFHAAEHIIINYYNKFNEVPKDMSKLNYNLMFSENCSFYEDVARTLFWATHLIPFTFLSTKSFFSFIIIGLAFMAFSSCLTYFLHKFNLLKYLEIIYLKKPTSVELEIAKKGLEAWIKMEKEFEGAGYPEFSHAICIEIVVQ